MSKEKPTTKICKHCKSEIPAKAKVCPQCRKRQGGMLKWIIILIVVLVIIGAIAGGKDNKPQKVESSQDVSAENLDEKTPEAAEEEKDTFGIGETAEMNDVQVTMTNYEESVGSEYNKPTDGNVFVIAEFEIVNNSDSELSVSSMMSFEAYADDYSLNYSLGALLEKDGENQLDGTVAPGKKMKGIIGYEVPEDWANLEIHFTDSVWSSNKFKFKIVK